MTLIKSQVPKAAILFQMAMFLFRCPNKYLRVQAWTADEPPGDDAAFFPVECVACRQMHYVNPATGRVLGRADDDE